ncbi:MAG TPA: glycoside hydrolase family 38 C-terminal domain-containing protein [Thermoanaerobaculaceae bacterium]|nr:glycoside hydrolase family 38 C-terminal domain-containing protein [Thermoanaerobaculaceae bacterium]
MRVATLFVGGSLLAVCAATAGDAPPLPATPPDVYVVATSHLDTQWRWTVQDTIDDFLPLTMRGNFALIDKYPGYNFSFEGAFHYMLMKEYYPADFQRLKGYVKAGRWKVAGSWVDAVDTNIPSPESLIRQALYGNGFFRREFGVTSRDVFLPDCFGFGFALPAVAAHCGLVAFSTQKLTWGSSIKIPFDVGLWEGVDGSTLIAALNPGDYASEIKGNLTLDADLYATADRQVALTGVPVAFKYFGTGDVGVPPMDSSVAWLEKSLAGPGPARVKSAAPDQMALDLMASHGGRAPEGLQRYRGEFLLTRHGTGCYTSQAAMKRFNRKNERLADDAEKAAVAAWWLGGIEYPRERLDDAWLRVLWHQFHDDLTGTSIAGAYVFSWNDETIAGNEFADVLSQGVGAVATALDTRGDGAALVVFNPLAVTREDAVEADVRFTGGAPRAVRVTAPDGNELPAQVDSTRGDIAHVVFVARVAPLSFTTFAVRPAPTPAPTGELHVDRAGLENARYRVRLDAAGDVASVFDKQLGRELLAAPLALQLIDDRPLRWPAWEIQYDAIAAPPRATVGGPAEVRVVEDGPARVALEVVRHADGSTFTQRIRLATGGAGDRLEIRNDIDWRTKETLLKAAFPLAAANEMATYDLGLGTVQRPTDRPNRYEVPAQEWADVTDGSGAFGAAVLNDCRYGWDKPDGHTLRLTLVHTPRVPPGTSWPLEQGSNDLGHHRVLVALAGHAGDWRTGRVVWSGDRLNQPLLAWQAPAHPGPLGRSFELLRLASRDGGEVPIAVRALKLAEAGDEVVVRLQELSGAPVDGVHLSFARPVVGVRELDGAEEPIAEHGGGAVPPAAPPRIALEGGKVVLDFLPYRPRTLALRLAPPPATVAPPRAVPLALPFDRAGITPDDARTDGDFDGQGHTVAGELLPATVVSAGIPFRTGPREPGRANVLDGRGQTLAVPAGEFNRLYLLAAAVGGDRLATFAVDGAPVRLLVPDWAEPVGQWNSRVVAGAIVQDPARIAPAYAKTVPVGWVGNHRHDARGDNEAYVFTQFFRLRLNLPPGARTVTLPDDDHVRILAATAARNHDDDVVAAQPFTDPTVGTVVHFAAPQGIFIGRTAVMLTSPNPGATIRYTLDGSGPTATSPVYAEPLRLERTTTVKARAFAPGLDDHFVATATYTKVEPKPAAPVAAASLAPGLSCRTYEGDWPKPPDFSALKPTGQLTLATVELPTDRSTDRFGMACRGFLAVPADGLYHFKLRSADASELRLDGLPVVENESPDFISRFGTAALKAGLHPIEVRYVHGTFFVKGLELAMDAPGAPLAPVPSGRLFHLQEAD